MASKIDLILSDCMPALHNTPDKFYDLAIVDPPYGGAATPPSEDASQNMNLLRGGAGNNLGKEGQVKVWGYL